MTDLFLIYIFIIYSFFKIIKINNKTMSEDQTIESYEIFYYFDSNGKKFYTPNQTYATIRAKYYMTFEVFVEKN